MSAPPTLYYNHFSICSTFCRAAFELQRDFPAPGEAPFAYNSQHVDIFNNEQLDEAFLELQAKGQVPVLVGGDGVGTFTDSGDILAWFVKTHPIWVPGAYAEAVHSLNNKLDQLDLLALTFFGYRERTQVIRDGLAERLASPSTSPRYRKLLEAKRDLVDKTFGGSGDITDEALIAAEHAAHALLLDLDSLLVQNLDGPWILPSATPSLLDSSFLILVARLHDVYRTYLIPPQVEAWAKRLMAGRTWQRVTGGKRTWWYRENGYAKPYAIMAKGSPFAASAVP